MAVAAQPTPRNLPEILLRGWKGNTRSELIAMLSKQPEYHHWRKITGFHVDLKREEIQAGIERFDVVQEAVAIVKKNIDEYNAKRRPPPPIKLVVDKTHKPLPIAYQAKLKAVADAMAEWNAAIELAAEMYEKVQAAVAALNPKSK